MISLRPHTTGTHYANEPGEKRHGFMLHTLFMYFASWSAYAHKKHMQSWVVPGLINQYSVSSVTWLGHATVLIELAGVRILVDPVFFNLTPLFRRIVPIDHLISELPPIDAVLISHNHWDHADTRSLKLIAARNPRATLCVPQGDSWWAEQLGYGQVIECMWGDQRDISGLKITFLPAHHWSQRTLFDRNKALWGSWMVEGAGSTIYHAGDTAPWHHFDEIARVFPSIDIACMPIGPCEPRNWLIHSHMGPEEAGKAGQTLGARVILPIHWGTYWFGTEKPLLPLERLNEWAKTVHNAPLIHASRMGEAVPIMPQQMPVQEIAGSRLIL